MRSPGLITTLKLSTFYYLLLVERNMIVCPILKLHMLSEKSFVLSMKELIKLSLCVRTLPIDNIKYLLRNLENH